MTWIVVDASVSLSWCFPDEQTPLSLNVLERLKAGEQAQAMVANLVAAYHKRLAALPWLAPSTRAEAQAKLDALYVGIGYPETWMDSSSYEVRPTEAIANPNYPCKPLGEKGLRFAALFLTISYLFSSG